MVVKSSSKQQVRPLPEPPMLEDAMLDPRYVPTNAELWRLYLDLRRDFLAHQVEFHQVASDISEIKEMIAQAKGGWKVLLALGTVLTGMFGAGAWIWTNIVQRVP